MIWHTALVSSAGLATLLTTVRGAGGIVTNCRPGPSGVQLTWTTIAGRG